MFSPAIAGWFASGASGAMEATTEAGMVYKTVYDEDIKAGKSPTEARNHAKKAADQTFAANLVIDIVTNKIGVFGGDKGLKHYLASSTAEGVQESLQQVTSNVASGKDPFEDVAMSGLIGTIIGFGGGAIELNGGEVDVNKPSQEETKVPTDLKTKETVTKDLPIHVFARLEIIDSKDGLEPKD